MKKILRLLLCTGLCAAFLALPSMAADTEDLPVRQGDFYVMVNGEYVTFPDAVPQIREDRSCLPFVAVFDQLGFPEENMTWDGATGTVTAVKPDVLYSPANGGEPQRGDLTVQLTIGSKEIQYWYEYDLIAVSLEEISQVTHTLQSEVAPYIYQNRTYVPFGLLAQALGYNVGWDGQIGAVIIDDVDAILAANTETYDLMDRYQAYNRTFAEKNQKVTGSYAMDLAMNQKIQGINSDVVFAAKGDYDMITAGTTAFQFDTDMTMDASMVTNGVDMSGTMTSPTGQPLFPMDLDFAMRGDVAQGVFYLQLNSQQLAGLGGADGESWYKVDMGALYDAGSAQTGMTYAQLMELSYASLEKDFSQLLPTVLKDLPLNSVQFTTTDYLALLNAICGDSHFVKSGSSYVNTFLNENGLQGTFTLYTSGDEVNGYAMEMKADPAGAGMEMAITTSMKDSKMEMAMNMDLSQGEGQEGEVIYQIAITLEMTMDGTYQTTSAQPATQPPAGAQVVDLMESLGSLLTPQALPTT